MAEKTIKSQSLSKNHRETFGLAPDDDDPEQNRPPRSSVINEDYFARHEDLKDIPVRDIRKAWFTMAHLVLSPGAKVVDMGCNHGRVAYAMAALNPQLHFIGIDADRKKIAKAKKSYRLPNLEYKTNDILARNVIEDGSVDAIINSFSLHRLYSQRGYDSRSVVNALESQFKILKDGGVMFIRDYAMPPPGEYVMLEMPDTPSTGNDIHSLSEPDLLAWYSENACPLESGGAEGFFLEELPERVPQTRMFRLSYKWAYEFITRKDDRDQIQEALKHEHAFFTPREFRKNLRALGSRVLYSAPHWDEAEIQEHFDGRFRLYNDEGTPLGAPPTSFIAVTQKAAKGQSLRLHERRPAGKGETHIKIRAMRNNITGKITDIISRDIDQTEIIPYRIAENGQLNIFVHESMPRGIVNAVPRNGKEIDGKRWSGHMTEAIAVPTDVILDMAQDQIKDTVLFARDYLGLKPGIDALLEDGPSFFPAPDFIDEHVKTRYLRVNEAKTPITPRYIPEDARGFTHNGQIREVSAQNILNAISVGYIPNSRLEMQIMHLCSMLDIEVESWSSCPLILEEDPPEDILDVQELARIAATGDSRYKDVKGTAGQLRTIQSIFVDEGWTGSGISGLAAHNMEFIISDENTMNKAVVLPLTRDVNGEIMAGLCTDFMPVPQRYQGSGLTATVPSFPLPKHITTIEQAKYYIAEELGVPPEKVSRLGESYFCHIGVTPQRIFPFAVACGSGLNTPTPVRYTPMAQLWYLLFRVFDFCSDQDFISALHRASLDLGYTSDHDLQLSAGQRSLYDFRQTASMSHYSDMTGTHIKAAPEQPVTKRPDMLPIEQPAVPLQEEEAAIRQDNSSARASKENRPMKMK